MGNEENGQGQVERKRAETEPDVSAVVAAVSYSVTRDGMEKLA